MAVESWHLLALVLLAVSALLIADYLAHQARLRRVRRRRLEARIDELGRERPTMNTRGRAP